MRSDSSFYRKAKVRGVYVEDIYKNVVWERDRGLCGICGQSVAKDNITIDHIRPASKGGTHEYANVQIAHSTCNAQKANKMMWELKAKRKKRKGHRRGKPWKVRKVCPRVI